MEYINIVDANGDDFPVPARRILCPRCNGDGKVGHPAFAEQAITAEEWYSEWSEEERDLYLGGAYDIECPECQGRLWTLVLDEDICTPEELQAYERHFQNLAELEAMERVERRFGC